MGVDWIPCRVEAGVSRDELEEHVCREAAHFRLGGSSMATDLDPRIGFSDAERAAILHAYTELGLLHHRLLFKHDSHRVSVISGEALFPIEWRIDAERTILPWELGEQVAIWQTYRDEVAQGKHAPFLRELYTYVHLHELAKVDVDNFLGVVRASQTATGSWSQRPEVIACRDECLAEPILTLPPLPTWPDGDGVLCPALLDPAFARVESLIQAWNQAVQRGNKRASRPRRPPDFDQWIATRLRDEWYASFLEWLQPWIRGGYGLYRDCE